MSKTIIYSCGKDVTSEELVSNSPDVDISFPEIGTGDNPVPLTDHEQVELLPTLIGKTIVTVSTTIILAILCEVRNGNLSASDVEMYCNGDRVDICLDGPTTDPLDGGFFETGYNVIFP